MIGKPTSNWEAIRYQLLTAICGTILQAKHDSSNLAVFVVHEFHTDKTTAENLQRNSEDYAKFLTAMGIPSGGKKSGCLHGPVMIDGMECLSLIHI